MKSLSIKGRFTKSLFSLVTLATSPAFADYVYDVVPTQHGSMVEYVIETDGKDPQFGFCIARDDLTVAYAVVAKLNHQPAFVLVNDERDCVGVKEGER